MRKNYKDIPILIGSTKDESIIKPELWIKYIMTKYDIKQDDIPKKWILSFKYTNALDTLNRMYSTKYIEINKEYPLIVINHIKEPIGFRYLGIGAPLASMLLEELIALGAEYIIYFGGVGVLIKEIDKGTLLLPTGAIRDEGTSYHYVAPGIFTYPSPDLLKKLKDTLRKNNETFYKGLVWTTDAPFRETKIKRKKFLDYGAICVDMEASALFAISIYRNVEISALFYAGDYVGEKWDLRTEKKIDFNKIINKLIRYSLETLIKM